MRLYSATLALLLLGCSGNMDDFSGPYPPFSVVHRNKTMTTENHAGKRVFYSDFGKVFREQCRRLNIQSNCYFVFESLLHRDECHDELEAIMLDAKNHLYVISIGWHGDDVDKTVQARTYGPVEASSLVERLVELSKKEELMSGLAQHPEPESTAGWGYSFFGYVDGQVVHAESMWVDSRIARFSLRGCFRYCPEDLFRPKGKGGPTWLEAAHYRDSLMWYLQMNVLIDTVIVEARRSKNGEDVTPVLYPVSDLD